MDKLEKSVMSLVNYLAVAVASAIAGYLACWVELDKVAKLAASCE